MKMITKSTNLLAVTRIKRLLKCIQLINNSFVGNRDIRTCDNGINALELTIIKLN